MNFLWKYSEPRSIDLRHRWSGNLGWIGDWRMCLASDVYGMDGWMDEGDER